MLSAAELALSLFTPMIAKESVELEAPKIAPETMISIAFEAKKVLRIEPTILRLTTDVIIVGDLHGNLWDLYRILHQCGEPPEKKYLFLGDLVDRGTHSAHVCCLVFALKVKWPEQVFVIRGNHEYRESGIRGGFYSDTKVMYPSHDIFDFYVKTFEFLPLAAIIDNAIFCVHGGIPRELDVIQQLNGFQRPVPKDKEKLVSDLLWSDPSEEIDGFEASKRGSGNIFGAIAVDNFLKATGMKMIIRGHECVNDGYRYSFNNKLLTLFSASGYCGCLTNSAGVCKLGANVKCDFFTFSVDREISDGTVVVIDDKTGKRKFKVGRIPTHMNIISQGLGTGKGRKPRQLSVNFSLPKLVAKPYAMGSAADLKGLGHGTVSSPIIDKFKDRALPCAIPEDDNV